MEPRKLPRPGSPEPCSKRWLRTRRIAGWRRKPRKSWSGGGKPSEETAYVIAVTDPNNHTTHYGYDADNRQITVTNALGYTTVTAFDPNGNVISVTDPLGNKTSYVCRTKFWSHVFPN